MFNIEKSSFTKEIANKIKEIYIDEIIQNFLIRFHNRNTKMSYQKCLKDYFSKVFIVTSEDFFRMLLLEYPNLVNYTSQYLSSSGLKANTIKQRAACLNSFYKWIAKVYLIDRNPVIKPELPKERRKSNTKSLCSENLRKKLKYLKDYSQFEYLDHLTYSLALILSVTSLRISEVLQVTVAMIKEGTLSIVQKRGNTREIDIPKEVQRELLSFAQKYDLQGHLLQTEGKRKPRKVLSRGQAYDLLKRTTGISCHGFRKSVIEILLERKVPIAEVKKVSGHESIEMVDYYDTRDTRPTEHFQLVDVLEIDKKTNES